MRKTKIICTLGPAVDSEEAVRALAEAGMDAARFNFSHGTHESHREQLDLLKKVRTELKLPIAAILDTKGPEIRIKTFENGSVELEIGQTFILTTEEIEGNEARVSVTYGNLHKELTPGCGILLDDGLIGLRVKEIKGRDMICTVESGGVLSNNKSINIPDVRIDLPSLTERDRADLRFAAEEDFDMVAASFVRKASDIADIRSELRKWGGDKIAVIAKIENREGVDNLMEILGAADGIMVARGDLGVEIPAPQVPILQKRMIKETLRRGKPVITATQMLDSMIRNPRPTRAEVSDVANAVFDGTSAVMLSGETASGKYPVEALKTMAEIAVTAEGAIDYWGRFGECAGQGDGGSINDAIAHSCCLTAMDLKATAILAPTQSGHTARMIARFRPACPIVAVTTTEHTRRALSLTWGTRAYLMRSAESTDEVFAETMACALREGQVERGDTVVITAGVPVGRVGSTNLIRVDTVR